jgi:hypothetical protein
MFTTDDNDRRNNRQENVSIRTIKSKSPAKCAICGVKIKDDTKFIRIHVNGYQTKGISLCLECVEHLNNLRINENK